MLLLEVIGMDHAAQVESALVMDVTRELAVVPSFAVPMVVASGAPLMDVASQFALVAFAMLMVAVLPVNM